MPSVTAPVIVLQTPSVTLYYHPDAKIVHHEIRKFVTGKDFRDLLTAGGDQMRKNLAKKWLSDDRGQWTLGKDDLAWSETQWAPQVAKAGWKYWAIVRADKVLAQVAMEQLAAKYRALGVTCRFFTDPKDALTWLEQQP